MTDIEKAVKWDKLVDLSKKYFTMVGDVCMPMYDDSTEQLGILVSMLLNYPLSPNSDIEEE